jgi:hypothetical protein
MQETVTDYRVYGMGELLSKNIQYKCKWKLICITQQVIKKEMLQTRASKYGIALICY